MFNNTAATFFAPTFLFSPQLSPQTPFLKEILVGRCYENSPFSVKVDCNSVAGSIMSILEGTKQDMMTPDVFSSYISNADFSSKEDKAIISFGKSYYVESDGEFVSVQDTPGGSFMKGLKFCGIDEKQSCGFGKFQKGIWRGAQASFWYAALSKFIRNVRGHIRVVIGSPKSANEGRVFDVKMLMGMDFTGVTLVDFLVDNSSGLFSCASTLNETKASLLSRGLLTKQITCTETDSIEKLLFCPAQTSADIQTKHTAKNNVTITEFVPCHTESSKKISNSSLSFILGFVAGVCLLLIFRRNSHRQGYRPIPTHDIKQ